MEQNHLLSELLAAGTNLFVHYGQAAKSLPD